MDFRLDVSRCFSNHPVSLMDAVNCKACPKCSSALTKFIRVAYQRAEFKCRMCGKKFRVPYELVSFNVEDEVEYDKY